MGLTEFGYIRRTYDDILTDKIQRAKELFGEDIDTSDLTPLGKFIRINAYDQAKTEEEIEAVYYARFPNTATGQSLDRLLVFGGISRNPATYASYIVRVLGTAGHPIEAGFIVGTDTGLTYWTTQDYIIGEDGTCLMEVCCTEVGTIGNVSAGAINMVVNPDANITSVEGVSCVSTGVEAESDVELRKRFTMAIAGSGSCNENAIRAAILRIPGVQFAAVAVNDTDETDGDGRPPHSFECYVLGGDDKPQEIAEAIYDKRPVGIRAVGTKSVTVVNASGAEQIVKYSPAPEISITIHAKIRTTAAYPSDGADQIFRSVADYINALGIGNPLVLSTLYGQMYKVPGVAEVSELKASTDGGATYSTGNVAVPIYGVAVCSNVIVEVISQ